MSKKDPFRFTVRLDITDKEHREVAAYLNRIGRRKARVIVKAVQAYLRESDEEQQLLLGLTCSQAEQPLEKDREPDKKDMMAKDKVPAGRTIEIENVEAKERDAAAENPGIQPVEDRHLDMDVGIDGYQIDQAEVELMRRNFEKLRREG
ncbi:MAG: hypothetical protein LUI87_16770 [Lachnospiraceae bacterium]|nr:hypothetical protein [Lachnospiraceae bacterium]